MSWQERARQLHERVAKQWAPYSEEDRQFLALSLAGEVGELCNLIKKQWRGDLGTPREAAEWLFAVGDELADVRIYLELLASAYSLDVEALAATKLQVVAQRWPEGRALLREEWSRES